MTVMQFREGLVLNVLVLQVMTLIIGDFLMGDYLIDLQFVFCFFTKL